MHLPRNRVLVSLSGVLILCLSISANAIKQTDFKDAAQKNQLLDYEPAIVMLEGVVKVRTEFGPPNYGENPKTDKREKVPVLILTRSINVRATTGDGINGTPVRGAKVVQLAADLGVSLKPFIDKRAIVTGGLFQGNTGHHHYAVVMSVKSIKRKARPGRSDTFGT
jgi:hypothetical protein